LRLTKRGTGNPLVTVSLPAETGPDMKTNATKAVSAAEIGRIARPNALPAAPRAWSRAIAARLDPAIGRAHPEFWCTLLDNGHLLEGLMDCSPAFSFGERG
jgi:hypothetical protein